MPDTVTTILLICVLVLLLIFLALIVVLIRRQNKLLASKNELDSSLPLIQQQITLSSDNQLKTIEQLNSSINDSLHKLLSTVNEQLNRSHEATHQGQQAVTQQLNSAGKTIGELKTQLGQLSQATQSIMQVGSEVKKLQNILQSPKLRGGLGEWSLEKLLAEVLPRQHYELQYRFKSGLIVDALVKLAQGTVSIDAKFPLSHFVEITEAQDENTRQKAKRAFLRDIRRHIDTIAEKYILPEQGTLDFALMYIPAENVYYETIINTAQKPEEDISAYSRMKKVICVSPNSLYAYLMVIATGLKGLQIEKNAQVIRQQLTQLTGEMQLLANDFNMVGKHLSNAKNKYNDTDKKLSLVNLHLQQINNNDSNNIHPS